MKKAEFDACAAKGVKDIIQIKIGFDGIVIATDKDGADDDFKTENLYMGSLEDRAEGRPVHRQPNEELGRRGRRPAGQTGIEVYGPPHDLGHPRRLCRTGHRGPAPRRVPDPGRHPLRQREEVRGAWSTRCAATAGSTPSEQRSTPSLAP
ncbi:hypothetical protein ACRAWD_26375 [Caulobacter segnis]